MVLNEVLKEARLKKRSENLMDGEWVELIHKDFEFDFKGEPTGHYARGRVIKWYDNEFCLVELFCNGKRYKVSKQIVTHFKKRSEKMKVVNEKKKHILHPIDCLCKEVGISRYRLAKNMGVGYSTLQSLVSRNSAIDNMNVGTLLKISNAVDLTLDETYAKLKSYEPPKYKVRWINGYGDEEGNIYPYQYFLEINGKEKVKIPNEIMNKFMNEHSNYANGIGTNMFRGRNEKELTIKLVRMLKENGII